MNSFEEYLQKCRDEKKLGPKTLELYERELVTLSQLGTAEAIRAHFAKLAPATCIRKLIIWRSFAKHFDRDLDAILASVHRPKLKQGEPNFLSSADVEKIRAQVLTLPIPEQLFFSLGLKMGLRLSEIIAVRKRDVEGDWLRVHRKGGKIQPLPMPDETKALMDQVSGDKVFKLHRTYYWKLVKKVGLRAGLEKNLSPHALRHTFATLKAQDGCNLVALKTMLGHAKLTTTERYLHIRPEYLRALVGA